MNPTTSNFEGDDGTTQVDGVNQPNKRNEHNTVFEEPIDSHPQVERVEQKCYEAPTSKNADYFNMNHEKRGVALIINHEYFLNGNKSRIGTAVDRKRLEKVLKGLKFEVIILDDAKHHDIISKVEEIASRDHTDHDCLLVVVLTHGENRLLSASDYNYEPKQLLDPFTADKCSSLAGKPKLFFIQACRGESHDPGVQMSEKKKIDSDDESNQTQIDGNTCTSDAFTIPVEADFLIMYSAPEGYAAYRNEKTGTWFIEALTKELEDCGKETDLLTLLTFVNKNVAINYRTNIPHDANKHEKKVIPVIESRLTRLLKFGEKKMH